MYPELPVALTIPWPSVTVLAPTSAGAGMPTSTVLGLVSTHGHCRCPSCARRWELGTGALVPCPHVVVCVLLCVSEGMVE